jgi:hypothetical protein
MCSGAWGDVWKGLLTALIPAKIMFDMHSKKFALAVATAAGAALAATSIAVATPAFSSVNSDTGQAGASAPDRQAPSKPGQLSVVPYSGHLKLSWKASTDNVGVTGYEVYFDERRMGKVSRTSLVFPPPPQADPESVFRVRAVDAAGNKSAFATVPYKPNSQ